MITKAISPKRFRYLVYNMTEPETVFHGGRSFVLSRIADGVMVEGVGRAISRMHERTVSLYGEFTLIENIILTWIDQR